MDRKPFVDAYQEINGRFIKLISSMSALRALSGFEIKEQSEQELVDASLDVLLEYHELDFAAIYLYTDDELIEVSSKKWNIDFNNNSRLAEYCRQNQSLIKQVEATGKVRQHVSASEEFPFTITAVPIHANNDLIGVFLTCHPEDEFASVSNERNLVIYCNFLGQLIMNSRLISDMEKMVRQRTEQLQAALEEASELKKRYEELSVIDELTELHNRRFFFPEAAASIARALRYKKEFSVLMIDIDHFKEINDRYGHSMGDAVLCGVANAFREEAREVDVLARFGGEEFVYALPETGQDGARILAERIRNKIKSLHWSAGSDDLTVSITIGITELKTGAEADSEVVLDELIKEADLALYHGKQQGRDQCISFSELSCPIQN